MYSVKMKNVVPAVVLLNPLAVCSGSTEKVAMGMAMDSQLLWINLFEYPLELPFFTVHAPAKTAPPG